MSELDDLTEEAIKRMLQARLAVPQDTPPTARWVVSPGTVRAIKRYGERNDTEYWIDLPESPGGPAVSLLFGWPAEVSEDVEGIELRYRVV